MRIMLKTSETRVSNEDSARNWKISSRLFEPITFLRQISLALPAERAVAMLI